MENTAFECSGMVGKKQKLLCCDDAVKLQRLERSSGVEEAITKVEEKLESKVERKVEEKQSLNSSECTPRYIGHDIDSEMASNLRMLCLVVLLLRLPSLASSV